jgi:type II secretory pathway pseudopilin PulG
MASSSQGLRTGIQVVLAIIIIGLAYVLYQSITEPYDRIQRQQQLTEQTRQRMSAIRTALIEYERDSTTYPDSLELLLAHVQRDSALQVEYDSLLGANFTLDSLLYSPRTGSRFMYSVNDTGRVETYLLEDPDSEDQIGTLSGDVTQTNSANWE